MVASVVHNLSVGNNADNEREKKNDYNILTMLE
jgi:hypothetical protein